MKEGSGHEPIRRSRHDGFVAVAKVSGLDQQKKFALPDSEADFFPKVSSECS